ncbi:Xbp1 [Trypoxylus dichotomus]
MSMSVPAILKYLNNNNNHNYNVLADMENNDNPGRSKKRRLDHLTWEEKIQRKKLKNRVAAQTSRDRKKAKMEQMESAIKDLFDKNEELISECEKLRMLNEKLQAENQELHKWIRSVPKPSAEGSGQALSSGFECSGGTGGMEDCTGLPSLPDLLDELNRDVDLSSLEEITQSLLQDIAADLEASAQKANCQEPKRISKECPEQMVGPTSEIVESDRCESVKHSQKEGKKQLECEISQYLLLHHDYFAKRDNPKKTTHINKRRQQPYSMKTQNNESKDKLCTKTKFKEILPKIEDPMVLNVKPDIIVDGCESDLVYGTYDENTNCIVIVNNDNLRLEEAVTEVTTSENVPSPISTNCLQVPANSDCSRDSFSPAPSSGYESIGSPSSEMDIWDECVSELFPSLI